jgi:excinuclease UvrABC ATPase subunit
LHCLWAPFKTNLSNLTLEAITGAFDPIRQVFAATVEVKYKGFTIADVLEMTVEQACEVFSTIPQAVDRLRPRWMWAWAK